MSTRRPLWRSVAAVTAVVLAVHAALIGAYVARGHDALDFARVAPKFAYQSKLSEAIRPDVLGLSASDPERDARGLGYDGQFNYFMALDPKRARYYMDDPAYRYSRPLYAAVSRLAAAGDSAAIPVALLAVNWLAIGVGTAAFALLMARGRRSVWLALLYGLAPGLVLGVHRDLTEPLAYALAILGVLALTGNRTRNLLGAGVLFGLAGLARQTALLFPLVYGAGLLLQQRGLTQPSLPTSRETVMTRELLSPEGEIGERDVVDGDEQRWWRPRSEASRRRAQRSGRRAPGGRGGA